MGEGGTVVIGALVQGPDGYWRPADPQPRRAGFRTRCGGTLHRWSEADRVLTVLTLNPLTGARDREMDARVRAVLPAPGASIAFARVEWRTWGLAPGSTFKDGGSDVFKVLAKRGLARLREEATAELIRREEL